MHWQWNGWVKQLTFHQRLTNCQEHTGGETLMRNVRILILTTDAGSGHRSAAQAIEAALLHNYSQSVQVTIANPLHEPSSPSLLRHAETFYLSTIQHAPERYDRAHALTDAAAYAVLLRSAMGLAIGDALRRLLVRHAPDVVISVYPLFTALVADAYRGVRGRPGLITVVTDLGHVHHTWFSPVDDLCIVPNAQVRTRALGCGLEPHQVRIVGIPVHPRFAAPRAAPEDVRRDLGWRTDLVTVLISGGGAGVGPLAELSIAADEANEHIQLAIVTGHNRELAATLRARTWKNPTHIYGFVPMADMMYAADIVATKAGGLSISEALAVGRPLLIYGAAPGQEAGNLEYVVRRGAAQYTPDATQFVAGIQRWIERPEARRAAADAARAAGNPLAAFEIARIVRDLALSRDAAPRLAPRVSLSEWLSSWR
jgi:1,2-diacylglycerol 3-beta-galactosyltransferase